MRSKQISVAISIIVMCCLGACGKEVEDTKQISVTRFNADNNTIKQEDESPFLDLVEQDIREETIGDMEQGYNKEEYVGELNIEDNNDTNVDSQETSVSENEIPSEEEEQTEEEDNVQETDIESSTAVPSGSYEISGDNVVYEGLTYKNLYLNATKVESQSKYNADTLIRFILKAYTIKSDAIFTDVMIDRSNEDGAVDYLEDEEVEYEDTDYTLDDRLSDISDNYNSIKSKYNEGVSWMLEVYTSGYKNVATIAGCNSYVIIIGANEDVAVDISNS